MQKNTSVTIGEHFEKFIGIKIKEGRFASVSEAVRAGLRLLEADEMRFELLRVQLIDGEKSGSAGMLEFESLRRQAKQRAGVLPPDE